MASHTVTDPRDTDNVLDVEFDIDSYGSAPVTWGPPEHCDPGDPIEITVTSARDITGANVLDLLTTDQQEAVELAVLADYDFSSDDRDDWEH